MATEVINYTSEAEWLQLRTKDITSTEVSALFGLSPYKTEFELFLEKRDNLVIKREPTQRMKWGNRMESVIAHGVAEDQGWSIEPLKVYMRDVELRIGSSFDFQIQHPDHGVGIMEIKNVDGWIYRKNWRDDGEGNIEAPEHIELQVQHQMLVAGITWCAIVAMVGGNDARTVFRKYDPEIGQAITKKVTTFWQRIAENEPPSADYSRDAELIQQLYSQVNQGEIFDASNDAETARLVQQWQAASADRDKYGKLVESYKAQILERVGTAERLVGPFGSITLSRVKDTAPTIITADMVGTSYGGRKGYRQFKLTAKKEK